MYTETFETPTTSRARNAAPEKPILLVEVVQHPPHARVNCGLVIATKEDQGEEGTGGFQEVVKKIKGKRVDAGDNVEFLVDSGR